jgi:hypothetical protein
MKSKPEIQQKDLENLLKKSVLTRPSDDLEEKVMEKIHREAAHAAGPAISKWVLISVYAILGIIFAIFTFVPLDIQLPSFFYNILDLGRQQFNPSEILGLMPSQSYLVMSCIVFAAAVWLVILFNMPKKRRVRKFI